MIKLKHSSCKVVGQCYEPRHYEDTKGIVAPKIGPKSFGTFQKLAPEGPRENPQSQIRLTAAHTK